jgi:hypothetical protein
MIARMEETVSSHERAIKLLDGMIRVHEEKIKNLKEDVIDNKLRLNEHGKRVGVLESRRT